MWEIKLKEGIDSAKAGVGVVYMTTLLSGLSKSGFTRLVGEFELLHPAQIIVKSKAIERQTRFNLIEKNLQYVNW